MKKIKELLHKAWEYVYMWGELLAGELVLALWVVILIISIINTMRR